MADIFISYARVDLDRVEPLAAALRARGWSVWWDSSLRGGLRFDEEIEKEIADARCVVVVWTAAACRSQWVRAEAAEALDLEKLVPCFLEKAKPPLYFRHVQGVELVGWGGDSRDSAFQRLVSDVSVLAGPASERGEESQAPETRASPRNAPPPGRIQPLSVFRDRLRDRSEGPEMVWIPSGSFLMGSPEGDEMAEEDERPQHEVRISTPFAMGRYPVTFEDYDRFVAAMGERKPKDEGWGRGRRPVINVSWDEAVAYCRWLSQETGCEYRLPTEAQWEYAARAGTSSRWHFGDGESALAEHAWFDENSGGRTHPVGEKVANSEGLHDVHGNVWEWCADGYYTYPAGPRQDPSGPKICPEFIVRGGSWSGGARYCRCARRSQYGPSDRSDGLGFRLTRGPDETGR